MLTALLYTGQRPSPGNRGRARHLCSSQPSGQTGSSRPCCLFSPALTLPSPRALGCHPLILSLLPGFQSTLSTSTPAPSLNQAVCYECPGPLFLQSRALLTHRQARHWAAELQDEVHHLCCLQSTFILLFILTSQVDRRGGHQLLTRRKQPRRREVPK